MNQTLGARIGPFKSGISGTVSTFTPKMLSASILTNATTSATLTASVFLEVAIKA